MSIPTRIQRMLDSGLLQPIQAPGTDVAALWEKALASARDSRNGAMSPDNQYVLGYQALLQMSTAILACAGYRTRGAQGHHANTFYAVAALGIEGLEDIQIRTERIRQMRTISAYEPGSPAPEQIEALRKLLDGAMPAARQWLAAECSAVSFAAYR